MNEPLEHILFALIRLEIEGKALPPGVTDALTPACLARLYTLAKSHDMAHVVASALEKCEKLSEDEISQKFQKQQLLAVYRYQQLQHELEKICRLLCEQGIPHLPLKGAIIRNCYPEPWMRTSCDIDLLIPEESLDAVTALLVENHGYRQEGKKDFHDVSLFSPGGVHLELHFSIRENMEPMDSVLSRVWEYAIPTEAAPLTHTLSPAFLLFHNTAHAAYHFVSGGCGIRPFLDLFLLQKHLQYDASTLLALCQTGGVATFYEGMCALSEVWFGQGEHTALTKQMGDYLLEAGVYGNLQNKIAVQKTNTGGTVRFVLSRIFVPYRHLVLLYPSLSRCPLLFPFLQVARWFRLFKGKKAKAAMREVRASNLTTAAQMENTEALLKQLGLG